MNECKHNGGLGIIANATYLEDRDVWMLDATATCILCNEPFRWLGVNTGVAVNGPMVGVDGTELRAPMEPASRQAEREALVPSSQRYVLETVMTTTETPRGPIRSITKAVAHDQWHLGEGCAEIIDALEVVQTKPAIPAAYTYCARCLLAGEPTDVMTVEYTIGSPLGAAATATIPVEPAQEGDGDDQEPAQGHVKPAEAALFIPPESDDGDGDAPPVGQAVTRERPKGRNR